MVESDLSYAAKTLPAKWDNEAGRITSGAAYAMLSRAMLYAKRWQSAKTAAEEVFKLGYVLMPGKTAADYAKAFTSMRDGNTESILEYNYLVGGPNHSWDKLFMPGGGSLDHDADLGVRVEGDPFGGELIHHPLAGPAALLHLPHAGDHGEHDGDLTAGAGPVQRPQLGAEHLGMVETDADGPQAQG